MDRTGSMDWKPTLRQVPGVKATESRRRNKGMTEAEETTCAAPYEAAGSHMAATDALAAATSQFGDSVPPTIRASAPHEYYTPGGLGFQEETNDDEPTVKERVEVGRRKAPETRRRNKEAFNMDAEPVVEAQTADVQSNPEETPQPPQAPGPAPVIVETRPEPVFVDEEGRLLRSIMDSRPENRPPVSNPALLTDLGPPPAGLQPNSIYVTFNAPAIDDYHRSILITYSTEPGRSATLFHAVYNVANKTWSYEKRPVTNILRSRTLVLAVRLGIFQSDFPDDDDLCSRLCFGFCEDILQDINTNPLQERNDDLIQRQGNQAMGGYSCLVWSVDALAALEKGGLVNLGGDTPEQVLNKARQAAGPTNGRYMVGKDHGPARIVNGGVNGDDYRLPSYAHPEYHRHLVGRQ